MNPANDLDRLLSAGVDGELSADDQSRLAVLLRDDSAARGAYLDYMLLDSLLKWEQPQAAMAVAPQSKRPRRGLQIGWVLAACVLVATSVGVFLGVPTREVAANPSVVDRLADWNLTIADAPTPIDRRERYRERADALGGDLARASLPAHERQLAESLFVSAKELADADNPLDVAERLDAMSEQIQQYIWAHSDADPKRSQAMERHYHRFAEHSLGKVRHIKGVDGAGPMNARRAERIAENIARRAEQHAAKAAERSKKKTVP